MNERQRDPRMNEILYPLYEEKRCTEIINDYELNEERKKAGKLTSGNTVLLYGRF